MNRRSKPGNKNTSTLGKGIHSIVNTTTIFHSQRRKLKQRIANNDEGTRIKKEDREEGSGERDDNPM